ncbi:acyltransferase family protein [Methylovorus mays]|uniref:acyltransferase family protein n=1 Tax=Methylovorus mays TaxID=184077 RepID=UPI001E52C83B|nr:acyltransferase [Methylovorus mays]MCB5205681.1 acyltransferase [Methylovorus mays]
MRSRELWVDYAKAIGIILVVYGHVARGICQSFNSTNASFQLADSVIYSFHMPLFFFLSGIFFVASTKKHGHKKMLLSKIDTILYPYILWSLLQGIIEFGLSPYTNGHVKLTEVFSLLWEPRAQFWFLYTLLFCFLICSVFFRLLSFQAISVFFCFSIAVYLLHDYFPSWSLISMISNNLVFFSLGILVSKQSSQDALSSPWILLFFTLLFLTGQYYFHATLHLTYQAHGIPSLLLAIISIFFIASLSSALANLVQSKFFAFIGSASLAIYLMHIIIGSGTRIALSKLLHVSDISFHIIAGCMAGILIPMLAFYYIRKTKTEWIFSASISKFSIFNFFNKPNMQNKT